MFVFSEVNLATDVPYWFTRETFFSFFDQEDFLNRDVKDVEAAYLRDWFGTTKNGKPSFYIPVTGALNEKTDLIGSRHRLAVILPHLKELPIAIATAHLTYRARSFLESIPKRPLVQSEPFWVPDLPVRDTLP